MSKHLDKFKALNPTIIVQEETEHWNIENLWDENSFMCRFKKDENLSSLENIYLPPEFSGIYNKKLQEIEFIWSPISKDEAILKREFKFYYNGSEFEASFSKPSKAIETLANGLREINPSRTNYRNLQKFRDFYKKEALPAYIQKFFENKTPIVFKVKGNFESIKSDLVAFAKNLNFYIDFYDRKSPFILIYDQEEVSETFKQPNICDSGSFPSTLNVRNIDPVLIDLFEVARSTANIRLKFLFYFQVLEYASYYHLTEDFKRRLTNIIKRPDLLNNSTYYGKLITEEFKDNFKNNDDSAKLEKLINEYINVDDIKMEISENHDFFKKDITFDGGFVLPAIINDIKDLDNPQKGLLKSIKTNIEKIRNVLVHIRETRENKVILPSVKNTNLLVPYLHLIQRIAEQVAIQYE